MRIWQPGSCFPISVLFTVIASVKFLLIYRRHASLSIAEADLLNLCEHKVHSIDQDLAKGGNLLNKRQCSDLSAKLSKALKNIKELVVHCGASSTVFFKPALENLYRILEKAKLLVNNCCHEDWCTSSVFQFQNEKAFQEILLELGLCYNAIYEQAKGTSKEWNSKLEDLRGSPTFQHASTTDVDEDNQTLQKRLEDLASERQLSILDCFLPGRLGLKQILARYLLVKLKCVSQRQSQRKDEDKSSAILWTEDTEPSGTWKGECYLGAGAGAKVWSTKWLGIPCAKKVFQGINIRCKEGVSGNETCIFSKEAGILAYLNHPRVVKFFCCGSGQKTGDGFIAMELMEMSLCELIRNQTEPFPLPVAVDIIMQIARGMCYLHEVEVAHRDLKPQNVVVNRLTYRPHLADDYFCVKLVDFGMSKTKVEVHRAHTISVCGVGTTIYRAPEVHPQAHLDGKLGKAMWFKADVYSFGVTCAEILTLQRPYKNILKISKLYDELSKGVRPDLPGCPPELVSLITDCWDPTPSSRPSFSEICSRLEAFAHKFIWMKIEEPSSMPQVAPLFVVKTDEDEVQSHKGLMLDPRETTLERNSSVTASSGGSKAGRSKDVKPFTGDRHEDAQALVNNLSEKLGKSNRPPKPTKRGNNKTGEEKPPKREAKKFTAEVHLHQSNSGEGKKTKESNGRKVDDCNTQTTGNARKRGKRKQALDDPTASSPIGKSRNEVPVIELKKRPRRDADKMLGVPSWPEELARHISNLDDGEEMTIVLRRPAVTAEKKHGRNSRKDPSSSRSRVKSISSGCPRIG